MTSHRNKKESERGIKLSGSKCIVCGWNKTRANGDTLLEGAHVKPHETGPECDYFDNIIALCPNHHAEYDAYNFYIDTKTKRLVFWDDNSEYNGLNVANSIKHIKDENLAYNEYLYKKNHGL